MDFLRNQARRAYGFLAGKHAVWARRKYVNLVASEYERAIILALQYIRGATEGDIVEFGSRGITAAVECKYLQAFGECRNIHLFDVFRGAIEIMPEDRTAPEMIARKWGMGPFPGAILPAELKQKLERLYNRGKIFVYEGWFKHTLDKIPSDTRFAMVVLDAVLFSGTDQALTYLFSHRLVSEGAVFMLSSWNVSRASPDQSTRKAWNKAVTRFKIEYSDEGRYNWGGARFIVHSYSSGSVGPTSH